MQIGERCSGTGESLHSKAQVKYLFLEEKGTSTEKEEHDCLYSGIVMMY